MDQGRPTTPTLSLLTFYLGDEEALLARLAPRLSRLFGLAIDIHPVRFDPERAFDPYRGQYNSRSLLSQLIDEQPRSQRILGITDVDLFMPVLTYVFGEAQLGGRVALVSTHRLRNEAYGLTPSPRLLNTRLSKEAIHELGHTFGLIHCDQGKCVMHRASTVEEIDIRPARFCSDCNLALRGELLSLG